MPLTFRHSAAVVAAAPRPRGRPRKKALPAPRPRSRPRKNPLPDMRFAPIRLAEVTGATGVARGAAPFACAFELCFPDGLVLRAAHDADPAATGDLVALLLAHGE